MTSQPLVHRPATEPEDSALIEARNITVRYHGRAVLNDVSLSVSRGEIVTLIGPNGAGKSTLAKVLLGLVKPDSGVVRKTHKLAIGYVPQKFPLDHLVPLTVARLVSLTCHASDAAIDAALAETGIAHLKHADAASLSGGEFQRALIARALLQAPDLLVLDEAVQSVDFIGETRLYRLIADIRRRHDCGIVMISHDLHVVMAESDRVICLHGHICCEGIPEKIRVDPEFVRLFGTEASGALAVYTHEHDHAHEQLDDALASSRTFGGKEGGV